jgi:sucrose synthase
MGESTGERVLTRLHSVRERIGDSLSANPNELIALFSRYCNLSCMQFSLHAAIGTCTWLIHLLFIISNHLL